MYSGPKIIKDGLIFGYDTGFGLANYASNRYYKGPAPKINYVAHQTAPSFNQTYASYVQTTSGTWPEKHPNAIRAYNAQGNEITGYVNTGVGDYTNTYHAHWQYDEYLNKPVVVMEARDSNWKAKSFGAQMQAWNSYGISAGDKYVISWDQWSSDLNLTADAGFYSKTTSNSNGFHDGRSNATVKNTRLNTWQRLHKTFTVASSRDLTNSYGAIYMYGHTTSNNGGTLKIANVQIELDTEFPSAFIEQPLTAISGSRDKNDTLRDIANLRNIDPAGTTFNSSGQPTFDGTNDHIQLGASSTFGLTRYVTLEAIVMRKSGGWNGIFGNNDGGSFIHFQLSTSAVNVYYYGPNLACVSGNVITSTSNYYHVVTTYDGSNAKIYVDGIEVQDTSNSSTANITSASGVSVGKVYSSDRFFNGEIPVMKVYNRALSASEIKENFQAYRRRFNI